MNIFLIGYRCTGKTTIGQQLARHLGFGFADTDMMVEKTAGMYISRIIDTLGWKEFRDMETRSLIKAAELDNTIISTGGGIILSEQNRKILLSAGLCVWLSADVDTIVQRLEADKKTSSSRPKFTRLDIYEETCSVLEERLPLYEQTHHIKINTARLSIQDCVKKISGSLKHVRI